MLLAGIVFGTLTLLVLWVFIAICFRVVVPTNSVHIVQTRKTTTSYGKDQPAGNSYFRWPSWVPIIGLRVIVLPVSVFQRKLINYAAYDVGRVPFTIDIVAFFRIFDSNVAAQRVSSFQELEGQLDAILQGAIRSILASSEIQEILQGRRQFGEMFTTEVDKQLLEWGVKDVKSIELMDVRDADGSQVIQQIMAKKKSMIEKESRIEVASNLQLAQEAEIAAKQAVLIKDQVAQQAVGVRTAEQKREVEVANQQAMQTIQEQAKVTTEKEMNVLQVKDVRAAEIAKSVAEVQAAQNKRVAVVAAEQTKEVAIVEAEGQKQSTVTIAEGNLEQAKRNAEGIKVEGEAKGAAEQAILMAPVNTQIELAREIGTNEGYQRYLVTIRQVEANQAVGVEQAKAIGHADMKVIVNSGNTTDGVTNAMQLLTPKGGLQLGAMLEALQQTPVGEAIVKTVTGANGASTEGRSKQ